MRFRWRGTLFRIHPLTAIMAAMACYFGLSDDLLATMLALGVHELAHLLAARHLNVAITSIDLLPFGGAAHMQNLYALSNLRLAGVALAGPLGNLAFTTVSAACGWAGWLNMYWASLMVQSNLILMLFNLLPALPLDGGRVLFALLSPALGEKKALFVGIWAGRILAAAVAGCALTAFLCGGKLNLTMLLAAVVILASGFNERAAQKESRASVLLGASRGKMAPHRLAIVAVHEDCLILDVARTLRSGEECLFALFSGNQILRFISQGEIIDFLADEGGKLYLPIKSVISTEKETLRSHQGTYTCRKTS